MSLAVGFIFGFSSFILVYLVYLYNRLVPMHNKIRNQWAQIDVQLKRRADLIPNLVATVRGYATHEQQTLEGVMYARNAYQNARSKEEAMMANGELSGLLSRLMAVSEQYPDLKANQGFLSLQSELSQIESRIGYARQFYNDVVLKYNDYVGIFPRILFIKLIGFREENFFTANEWERMPTRVEF